LILKTSFIILGRMEGSPAYGCGRLASVMTRCECSELSFDDIVRRVRGGGRDLDALQAETGVGLLCTACLPDLRERLSAEGVQTPAPGAVCLGAEALDSLAEPD
jgi:NAD(P)H-nitrite reductase large subunit